MQQMAFDTLKFMQKLISSGMPERQAKAQVARTQRNGHAHAPRILAPPKLRR